MTFTRIKTLMDNLRGNKEFFGWIIAIVVATVGAMGWFSQNFITIARGSEMMSRVQSADIRLTEEIKALAGEVKASNSLLMTHMEKEKLNTVMLEIRRTEAEIFQIEQSIAANGTNTQAAERLRLLKADYKDLELKRDCIINKNPLCD